MPGRTLRDEVIPLMIEIDEDLRLVERISESLAQIKTCLHYWKGRTNDVRPIGALPVELLSKIFDHVHDSTEDIEKVQAVVRHFIVEGNHPGARHVMDEYKRRLGFCTTG